MLKKQRARPSMADLLSLPDSALLTSVEAATLARLTAKTLSNYRSDGNGPPYCRPPGSRKALYVKGRLLRWLAGQLHASTTTESYSRRRKPVEAQPVA